MDREAASWARLDVLEEELGGRYVAMLGSTHELIEDGSDCVVWVLTHRSKNHTRLE